MPRHKDVFRGKPAFKLGVASTIVATLFFVFDGPESNAQTQTANELIVELGQRTTAVESLGALERAAARIVYVESVALLSHFGDWPERDAGWVPDTPKYFYDVHKIADRFPADLAAIRRTAARPGVFSDEERERFTSLIGETELLIEDSQTYYGLLAAEDFDLASAYFRDSIMARYESIEAGSYTLRSGVLRDISRISRLARNSE
jgi:hypothetical protein